MLGSQFKPWSVGGTSILNRGQFSSFYHKPMFLAQYTCMGMLTINTAIFSAHYEIFCILELRSSAWIAPTALATSGRYELEG